MTTDELQAMSTRLRETRRGGAELIFGDPLFIIVTPDPERDRVLAQIPGTQVWLADTVTKSFRIYEDQPSDFYGVRASLEAALSGAYSPGSMAGRRAYANAAEASGSEGQNAYRYTFPWVTVLLIAANVIYFIVLVSRGDIDHTAYMLRMGANYAPYVFEKHEYWRLISCMFMHFGIAHLASNMFYLGIIGFQLERKTGPLRFFLLYMLSGILASLISAGYHLLTNDIAVSAGASGAVYGLIGAMILLMIRRRDSSMFRRDLPRTIFLVFFVIYSSVASSGVDGAAHIGGVLSGALLSLLLIPSERRAAEKQRLS